MRRPFLVITIIIIVAFGLAAYFLIGKSTPKTAVYCSTVTKGCLRHAVSHSFAEQNVGTNEAAARLSSGKNESYFSVTYLFSYDKPERRCDPGRCFIEIFGVEDVINSNMKLIYAGYYVTSGNADNFLSGSGIYDRYLPSVSLVSADQVQILGLEAGKKLDANNTMLGFKNRYADTYGQINATCNEITRIGPSIHSNFDWRKWFSTPPCLEAKEIVSSFYFQ